MAEPGWLGSRGTEEVRYRLLVDAVTDYAIYMLDPEGRVVSWNPGAERIKGYAAAEILGRHFCRFYTEEDRKAGLPARALASAAAEGRFETEGWCLHKTGSRFWAHSILEPIRDPAGALLGYAKVTRDLTERRRAKVALRRSEEQFRLLVQGVTDYAIYLIDPNGLVSSWNLGAERIKGYRPEEIIGQPYARFFTPEDRQRGEPQRALETAAREGRFENEGWRLRQDGSRFRAHVVVDAIRDEAGTLLGFAKVTRDVTERQAAQRALEEAREALFQAQKMEAVGQLTGGVAHDFNNLLMAIQGSLELLRRRLPEEPRITQLLDNALQGVQRGTSLTRRMLAFARRQQLRPEPVELPALVRGMTDLLQRSLGPAVLIETRFPARLPPLLADAHQLELALLNLAVNARDAMPEGGAITIAAEEVSPAPGVPLRPGRYIRLSVADTGEGMDAETLARAVEPFFTTKGVGKGTGLGLSMVHGLAEQSGGRLILHSRKGEGTTAELWLPVADPAATVPAGGDAPPAVAPPVDDRALLVLAVDDDILVLTNTAAMLEDLGHRVVGAGSARQALELLRQTPVDLVVTDQAMPQMSGTQLAAAIRAEWPRLPVILVSGYADPVPAADGLPRLAKPFSQTELARSIAAVAGGVSSDRAPA